MKFWFLRIQDGAEGEIIMAPYQEDAIPFTTLPARYIGKWITVTATGPHEVPTPAWWPRQLAQGTTAP